MTCPFCNVSEDRIVARGQLVLAITDKYPVSKGHTLIIPKRHVASYFDLTEVERSEMQRMMIAVKLRLDADLKPEGYNFGVNIGRAAGQTIDHVHMHLIPRYGGDMPDPRGGVRGVIPERQKYPKG
ncbi:MAG: HIT family protein [Proteobacteria bacterium]|nr:HIT family protein [Pseudomonadota bacterium]